MRARYSAVIVLLSCATFGQPMGEVAVAIESVEPIDRIEFIDPETGNPFQISAVPAGSSLFKEALRVGRYCLTQYVVGQGSYGKVYRPESEICLDVTEGKQAYPGHFVFAATGALSLRSDPVCLANQLGELAALGNTLVTPCAPGS
jgi:hypothetical protein